MKRTELLIFLFLSTLNLGVAQDRIPVLSKLLKDTQSDYVFVIAHRGDWRNAPENSVSSIKKAVDIGVDMVEIDIQRTKDGIFILMHDDTIDRTTDGNGKVSEFTFEQLKQFRLKNHDGTLSDERIPALKDALLTCKDKIMVNIDKGGDHLDLILPLIEETDTKDHVILKGTGSVSAVKAVAGLTDFIYMPVIHLTGSDDIIRLNSFLTDLHPFAVELIFHTDTIPVEEYARKITESNARVWINSLWASLCGGHDDEKALSDPENNWGWLLKQHATMIQTDRPEELIRYLESKGRRKVDL